MRLNNRHKRTFYVSNETAFSSGEYDVPYKITGLFIPRGENVIFGGGVTIQGNTDAILIESVIKGVKLITQNSRLWINKKPLDKFYGEDYTHKISGMQASSNRSFIVISLKSVSQDVPIL